MVFEFSQDSVMFVSGELFEYGIRSGDIVFVVEQFVGSVKKREIKDFEKKGVRGVVIRINKGVISVVFDEGKEEVVVFGGWVWVVKLVDEVMYKRYELVFKFFEFCLDIKVIYRMN